MKSLFLHVPKFNNHYKPIGDFIWINYMPMGFLAIADHIKQHGFDVEIVHLGVEWVVDRNVKLDSFIDDPEIKIVGMTLHWHYQSYDVIEAARRIKEKRPDIFIFIGGYTASYFHEEIVRDFPMIDAVVRGDGEKPVLQLHKALRDNKGFDSIDNLTWRDGKEVKINEHCYIGDEEEISNLSFTNFSLLRNADTYIQYIGLPFFFAKGFTKEQNFKMFTIRSPMMPVPIGRGCPFNCTWCGGSQVSQQRHISKRVGFVYRTHDAVIQSIREGMAAGYQTMHTATDPEPETQEYFIELWKRIREEGIETNWFFECNGLPTDTFVEEFHKTFPGPDSLIALSPECGNEAQRLRHKGPGFTTAAFFDKMDKIDGMGISSEIFFSYGLPGENEETLEDTIAMRKEIIKRYKHVRGLRTLSIEMEPGSPWQVDPGKYGIVTDRKSFKDYYETHSEGENCTYNTFGYYIPDYFKKPLDQRRPYEDFADRMQKIKCKKLCFLHPNPKKFGKPWQGRLMCTVASNLLKLKPKKFVKPF